MRTGRTCFLLLALAGIGLVALTLAELPARMAIHFDLYGRANGWSGKGAYVGLIAAIGLLLPVAMVGFVTRLGATRPEALNVPGRDYWFQPERRNEGVRRVANHMWWLACLMLALAIAMHGLMLLAHASDPPRLPTPGFLALVSGFLLGIVGWVASLSAAMRAPPAGASSGQSPAPR
jgi:hypothetical protein